MKKQFLLFVMAFGFPILSSYDPNYLAFRREFDAATVINPTVLRAGIALEGQCWLVDAGPFSVYLVVTDGKDPRGSTSQFAYVYNTAFSSQTPDQTLSEERVKNMGAEGKITPLIYDPAGDVLQFRRIDDFSCGHSRETLREGKDLNGKPALLLAEMFDKPCFHTKQGEPHVMCAFPLANASIPMATPKMPEVPVSPLPITPPTVLAKPTPPVKAPDAPQTSFDDL